MLGKRANGYHDLSMVMTRISLFDEVTLTLKAEGVSLECDNPLVPSGADNIAWKAAQELIGRKNLQTGVDIAIKKRIPMGGGLGGGSSNAAAVLMGLNELTGKRVGEEELMEMGLNLGADVPFFIFNRTALAEGVGEVLSPVDDLPGLWLILINPGIHVPTAEIFGNLNLGLTNKREEHTITRFYHKYSMVVSSLYNDLEKVTFRLYPKVREARDLLLEFGATGSLMSGSGSTVFGIYRSEEEARHYYSEMKKDVFSKGWESYLANSL